MELKLGRSIEQKLTFQKLLIVPYGIETFGHEPLVCVQHSLLIVPYGIETTVLLSGSFRLLSFNRTLWN